MITYIVSVYDRIPFLNACLGSLVLQDSTTEIIVCCNSTDREILQKADALCKRYEGVTMLATGNAGAKECYQSANMVATRALGEWICFASDDSLYVCQFSRIMLQTANLHAADLVYCDCVYRQDKSAGQWPEYTILETQPKMGRIDKTCFILRRELFKGFPPHPQDYRDGALIEQLVAQGVRHAKAPGVLVVHQ